MSDKDKDYVFTLIDAFIARNKLKTILKLNPLQLRWVSLFMRSKLQTLRSGEV